VTTTPEEPNPPAVVASLNRSLPPASPKLNVYAFLLVDTHRTGHSQSLVLPARGAIAIAGAVSLAVAMASAASRSPRWLPMMLAESRDRPGTPRAGSRAELPRATWPALCLCSPSSLDLGGLVRLAAAEQRPRYCARRPHPTGVLTLVMASRGRQPAGALRSPPVLAKAVVFVLPRGFAILTLALLLFHSCYRRVRCTPGQVWAS